uniref:Putative secreted peptide n=1 Tax=Anopheles braziliensis TaxID=58242 RepID=A0A2M3ZMZ0_9DIPT
MSAVHAASSAAAAAAAGIANAATAIATTTTTTAHSHCADPSYHTGSSTRSALRERNLLRPNHSLHAVHL